MCATPSRTSPSPGRCSPNAWAPATPCCRPCRRFPTDTRTGSLRRRAAHPYQYTLSELLALAGEQGVEPSDRGSHDPHGYGRIVRNAKRPRAEDRRAKGRQSARTGAAPNAIPACWLLRRAACKRWLTQAQATKTLQAEYYLTDIIALAVQEKIAVGPLLVRRADRSARRKRQGAARGARGVYRPRRRSELMRAGVTLADPARLDVRGTVERGAGTCSSMSTWFSRAG